MRTNINLDEDVYHHATLYAKRRGVTLRKAICELARKGIEAMQSDALRLTWFERQTVC
jgi:hypothetical protein